MKKNHIASFSGVRAIALIAIVLFHFDPEVFKSGFLFVNIFFILSGYFLTQRLNDSENNLFSYWFRKIKQLWLPLLIMMAVILSVFYLIDQNLLINIRLSSLAGLTFTSNWLAAFSERSYFDNLASVELWAHLWYLAVHVQVFSFFTLLFWAFKGLKVTDKFKRWLIGLLTLTSMLLMAFGYLYLDKPMNVYYFSLTRMFAFGLGSMMALTPFKNKGNQGLLSWFLGLSLIAILAFYQVSDAYLYLGGMQLFSIISVLWLATLTQQHSFSKLLSTNILKPLSKYSYEAYLYSYPLTILINYSFSDLDWANRLILILLAIASLMAIKALLSKVHFYRPLITLGVVLALSIPISINPQQDPELLALQQNLLAMQDVLANQQEEVDDTIDETWPEEETETIETIVIETPTPETEIETIPETVVETTVESAVETKVEPETKPVENKPVNKPKVTVGKTPKQPKKTETAVRKPAAKTPTVKPPVQKPPVQKPPVQKPPVQKPPVQKPPVQKPPVSTKPAEPPVVTPTDPKKPPVETKPVEPPVQKPKPVSTKLTAEDVALSRKAIQPKPRFSNTEEFVKIMALNPAQKAYLSNLSITFIGDSIFLNASRNLKSIFPKSYIDAKISRQMYHAEAIMKDLLAKNRLKRIVIIHLGTNSPFKMECLNNIMKIAGPDRIVFFVNVRLNRKTWEKDVNNKLATIVKQHGNAHLINWYAFSVHHNNIFYKDQEHPTTNRGNKIFSTFIGHSIIATLNR